MRQRLSGPTTVRRLAALDLAVLAVCWLRLDRPVEGRVLLTLAATHGLTVADLPSLVALLAAGWLFFSRRRVR